MHDKISFYLLDALLLLLFFSGSIVAQVQLIPVVNWQLLANSGPKRLEDKVNDLVPSFCRGISA